MKQLASTIGLVVGLGALALLAACGPAASAVSTGSSTTSQPATTATTSAAPIALPVLVIYPDVVSGPRDYAVIRPTVLGMAADINAQIRNITWTSWTSSGALGHGSRAVDDCNPDCADGRITYIPETVTLSDVVGGRFMSLTETYNNQTLTSSAPIEEPLSSEGGTRAPLPAPVSSATPSSLPGMPLPPGTDYNNPVTLANAVAAYVHGTSGQTVLNAVCTIIAVNKFHCVVTLPSGPDDAAVVVSTDGTSASITSSG
ncbi:MAG TPA: hypothetical protein VGM75_35500 [Pseudonocardiaceae bacterium]